MGKGALHCPTCGAAAASSDAKSCTYCGTRLAAIQCARCFATMFVGSKYCPHCGAMGAQRRVTDETRLFCPRCKTPDRKPLMEPFELHGIHLDECAKCGGVWIDPGVFERILTSAEAQQDALSMLGPARGQTEPKVRYIRCPLCNQQMHRRNYATRSGVIIDFCRDHGLWLDHDELRRIVEFVRTGGLDDAARAQAERELSDQERKRSADHWFGKDETLDGRDDIPFAGRAPSRLLELILWSMKK